MAVQRSGGEREDRRPRDSDVVRAAPPVPNPVPACFGGETVRLEL